MRKRQWEPPLLLLGETGEASRVRDQTIEAEKKAKVTLARNASAKMETEAAEDWLKAAGLLAARRARESKRKNKTASANTQLALAPSLSGGDGSYAGSSVTSSASSYGNHRSSGSGDSFGASSSGGGGFDSDRYSGRFSTSSYDTSEYSGGGSIGDITSCGSSGAAESLQMRDRTSWCK